MIAEIEQKQVDLKIEMTSSVDTDSIADMLFELEKRLLEIRDKYPDRRIICVAGWGSISMV